MVKRYFLYFTVIFLLQSCASWQKNNVSQDSQKDQDATPQVNSAIRVAIVDIKTVEAESLAMKDAFDKLKNKQKSIQQVISKRENELQEEIQDIQSKQGVLAAKTIEEKRKAVEVKIQKLQQFIEEMNRNLEATKLAVSDDIARNMQQVVASLSVKKYSIVLPSSSALYISDSEVDDITPGVVSGLNKRISKVDIDDFYKKVEKEYGTSKSEKA